MIVIFRENSNSSKYNHHNFHNSVRNSSQKAYLVVQLATALLLVLQLSGVGALSLDRFSSQRVLQRYKTSSHYTTSTSLFRRRGPMHRNRQSPAVQLTSVGNQGSTKNSISNNNNNNNSISHANRRRTLMAALKQPQATSDLEDSKIVAADVEDNQTDEQIQHANGNAKASFRKSVGNALHKFKSKYSDDSLASTEETMYEELNQLQSENDKLRAALHRAEVENDNLHHQLNGRIVLETFEGEGRYRPYKANNKNDMITMSGEELLAESDLEMQPLWCDELEDGTCPIEPTIGFGEALRDRAYWLVGLLVLQSCSGIILARNEALLANHPVIIYFLTMLVGAGGNAGNQASVRVIRGLALGTLNEQTQNQFLVREFKMACSLSGILSLAGFARAAVFRTPLPETVAVTTALFMIVFISVCLGAILPLILKRVGVDPAHSSTTIQVIMDILGVFLAVVVSGLMLDNAMIRGFLFSRLGLGDV